MAQYREVDVVKTYSKPVSAPRLDDAMDLIEETGIDAQEVLSCEYEKYDETMGIWKTVYSGDEDDWDEEEDDGPLQSGEDRT